MTEFELINNCFRGLGAPREDVVLGIGDDGAIVRPAAGRDLVVAVDTLVCGQHFQPDIAPDDLGYRLAAVNLSDLAAMAATPRYATLALTLPAVDPVWLGRFASGLGTHLQQYDCALIGGDTTRGPLSVTLQLIGELDGPAWRRDGAQIGDRVFVTGTLGDARAALEYLDDDVANPHVDFVRQRYLRPQPRLQAARILAGEVHAAIDISDGLLADLGHVASASAVAITVEAAALPQSAALRALVSAERALEFAATGGDDYELALCVPAAAAARISSRAAAAGLLLTPIGRVCAGQGVVCQGIDGTTLTFARPGYQHF